ncbi:MAG TPA: hypothetical protein DEG17_21960 [Cyanobacteria bacterium UBA11149]|nr:hypothetical protein [Cyanobacteria bacterium UBA11367]HBE57085.1 hypothetical protein [Cyanobacteria bacterium UBA11366]HBR74462.1 hypothetical protein [Cyanobacteria bacterium UBA11159]HBS70044.1 hypothetical protein [Cyanobacteria bacterium UBA11153]HBW91450.1 hypothetical protein [Cyanobacteria bacterium UBA11149]HCA97002.1 hypothetical protein [Cyanobacteria bacterium UBA9226]
MAYSDFSLASVKKTFNLTISSQKDLFSGVSPLPYSNLLKETLDYNVPFALASNTEKSRSEMIIAPILLEVTKKCAHQISLFSGVDFHVDKEQGLNGTCDFMISRSSELLIISAPVILIVEAKRENINLGLGQCVAEMYGAKLFNQEEGNEISRIYGVVTTGEVWKFLRLEEDKVEIDLGEYFLNEVNKILGILVSAVGEYSEGLGAGD